MSAPPPPTRPTETPPKRSRGSWASLVFVAIVTLAFVSFLILGPTGRIGIAILVGGMVFPAIIALHYFTWGRWMRRVMEQEERDRERDD